MADSRVSNQLDPEQEKGEEVKEGEEEKKVEKRVPATTMVPTVPVVKKKYPVCYHMSEVSWSS